MKTTDGPGMGITKVLALVAVVGAAAGAAAEDPEDALERHRRDTPCFSEYRDWIYGVRTPESFEVPPGLTPEKCAQARQVSEQLGDVPVRSKEARRRQQEEDQRQRAFKAELDRLEAESATARKKIEAETRQLLAAHARARAELARRPPATIGMTQDQALATRWGKPYRRSRVTTSAGTSETWHYERGALQFSNGRLATILEN